MSSSKNNCADRLERDVRRAFEGARKSVSGKIDAVVEKACREAKRLQDAGVPSAVAIRRAAKAAVGSLEAGMNGCGCGRSCCS